MLMSTKNINAVGQSVSQNTKGAVQLEKKISQKITTIVKKDGIVWMDYHSKSQSFIARRNENGELIKGKYPVFITSDNPVDSYFSNYTSNTGMTDFVGKRKAEYVKFAKKEHDIKGSQVVLVEKKLLVDTLEINAQMSGEKAVLGIRTDSSNFYETDDMLLVPGVLHGKKMVDWVKVANPTVSQARGGDLKFIPAEMMRLDWLNERYGFSIPSYTIIRKGMAFFNAVKSGTRVALAASSGKRHNIMPNMTLQSKEVRMFTGLNNVEIPGEVFVHTDETGKEFKPMFIREDFEVEIEEEIILNDISDTESGTSLGVKKVTKRLVRPVTDGSTLMDADYAKSIGLENSHQFRWAFVTKGMMTLVPGLRDMLGVDVVAFGGAIKGDVSEYMEKGINDYFVLGDARQTLEKNDLFISRQFFGAAALLDNRILDKLGLQTKEVLSQAFNFDDQALKLFVGLNDEEDVDGEKVLDTENLTGTMYEANPLLYKKSATNKRKLMNLISSSVGELLRGARLYAKNTSFKHMVVDPYTVISYMMEGKMGVVADEVKQRGIRRHQLIVSAKETRDFKDGAREVFFLEHKEAVLARFPNLHKFESQKVNEDDDDWMVFEVVDGQKVYDNKAGSYYHQMINEGHFQGMAIYSLWDMLPEGQSGADFDGDETLYITDPAIVDHFEKQPLFLDYSLLNGEMVEGVPWKDDMIPTLEEVVSKEQLETLNELGVTYESGEFSYPEELVGERKLELILADAMGTLAGLTNTESHIGVFTNINTSIMEIELILQNILRVLDVAEETPAILAGKSIIQDELKGYERLSFFMASAIRWEIDKAKHGGAFLEKMPWLKLMLNGVDSLNELLELEELFDISLERLFYGSVNKSDSILNKILAEFDLAMPVLSLDYAPKMAKPRISSSIYKGKNQVKGADYIGSPYTLISEDLEAQRDELFAQPIQESVDNYRVEALRMLEMAEEAGIKLDLVSFADAHNQLNSGVPADTSPSHLLTKFRADFSSAKNPINELRNQLLARYEEESGQKLYDSSKATIEWLSKKMKLSREEQDNISKVIANFDLTISYYDALSEKMDSKMYGDYKYGAALLYAQLYLMTLHQNLSHKENNLKKRMDELEKKFANKYGRLPKQEELALIKEAVSKSMATENESGFSSIQSLFPLGAVQFLQVMSDNKSVSEKKAGRNVCVYLDAPAKLTDRDVNIWKSLVGSQVTFENGYLFGYKIDAKEDLLSLKERTANPSSKDLAHLPENVQKFLMEMKFKRGAKNWMGDKQQGVILHVTTYKKSVKLWLSGVHTIA